ncbi:hydroxyacid dehydrogenase [Paenibacillus glycanilyticus]|uniref:hydroxyacid dehydrogenase n=1 Tax=Paenibacillus glycanilyticus TaxID=126569 RepID=UPI000FDB640C|nr:hydroxyacid dehydrogenase [Paenibacillus glycanilyticus]
MKFLVTMGECETRDSFFTPRAIAELKKHGEVVFNDTGSFALTKAQLMEMIGGVDVLFSGWGAPRVDADVLAKADRLKVHAHTGGTVAGVVSHEEYGRGIAVLSGNDLYARSVAEGCLMYTLMGLRRAEAYVNAVRQGGWRPEQDRNTGLIGKKVGLVGYGAIAQYYAELLQGFDVELYVYSKYMPDEEADRIGARRVPKEYIFEHCDVISLHSALNEENRGMITASLLSSIKAGALFVNTARAGLVDDDALLKELQSGRFQTVLDVYPVEPLATDSPFRSLDNALLLPHIAGPTFDMREKVVLELLADVLKIQQGESPRSAIPYDYAVRMTTS